MTMRPLSIPRAGPHTPLLSQVRATARSHTLVIVLGVLVTIGALDGPALHAQGPAGPMVKITRGWALDRDGLVKVFNAVGTVQVIGWERDSVALVGSISKAARFFGGGNRRGIKMGIEGDQGAATPRAEFVLYVPAGAVIWVRGAATDISVEGLSGGVDCGSVSGAVRVLGDPRDLVAESMEGTVEIIGSPSVLRAKTASGALLWTGQSSDATLGSVTGSIETLRGPLGRVRIETISGTVRLGGTLAADAEVVIESHSGDVELRLPAKAPARLHVDAARFVGAPGKPDGGAGKRPGARAIALNSPGERSPLLTVRAFKGEVRLLPAEPARTP